MMATRWALFIAALTFLAPEAEAGQCACATANLNLRQGAGTSYGRLATVRPGTCLPHDGWAERAGGYTWLHLNYNGQSAWAVSDWLRLQPCSGGGGRGATNCYGDVNDLRPSGKANGGVSASQFDVDYRINRLNEFKACMEETAREFCIEASLIGAVASRETNGGASMTADGRGIWDKNGYGLMQCDLRTSGLPCQDCLPKSCCHVKMMVRDKIVPDIQYMQRRFPSWPVHRQVQAAIAAYNTGRRRVRDWATVDSYTTDKDYSNDVIARAQHLKKKYSWS